MWLASARLIWHTTSFYDRWAALVTNLAKPGHPCAEQLVEQGALSCLISLLQSNHLQIVELSLRVSIKPIITVCHGKEEAK